MTQLIILLVGGLVTWRISHMLVKEKGPLDIFARFRASLASSQKRSGGLYDMVSCVGCTSVYVGALMAPGVAWSIASWITYTILFSAIAMFIEQIYTKLRVS